MECDSLGLYHSLPDLLFRVNTMAFKGNFIALRHVIEG